METDMIPEGRGKAEAMRTFLARGGGLNEDGTYRKGPMKGKTVQEATSMFEDKWATVDPSIKDKYARRARNVLAPIERPDRPVAGPGNAELNASLPGENSAQRVARQRASRMGSQPTRPPVAPAPTRPPVAPPAASGNPAAIGTPEEQAKVQSMVDEGSGFATADTGDAAKRAAVAQQRANLLADAVANPPTDAQRSTPSPALPTEATPPPVAPPGQTGRGAGAPPLASEVPKTQKFGRDGKTPLPAVSEAPPAQRTIGRDGKPIVTPPIAAPGATSKPTGSVYSDEYSQGFLDAAAKGEKYPTREEAGKPFVDPGLAPGDNYEAEEAVRRTNNAKIEADNAKQGLSPLAGGAVTPPSTSPGASPPPPVAPTPPPAKAPRINSLTGLPMGYRPGDAVAPAQQAKADESVLNQQVASAPKAITVTDGAPKAKVAESNQRVATAPPIAPPKPAPMMPRGPASQRAATGSALDNPANAFSKDAYKRTAAAEQRGVQRQAELAKAKNVDDPAKFFTGRKLPLDQLVRNQKIRGSTMPPVRPPVLAR